MADDSTSGQFSASGSDDDRALHVHEWKCACGAVHQPTDRSDGSMIQPAHASAIEDARNKRTGEFGPWRRQKADPSHLQMVTSDEGDYEIEIPSGSYFYPPPISDPEVYFAYWMTVDVPDEACDRARAYFADMRPRILSAGPSQTFDAVAWRAENPMPSEASERAAWDARFVEAINAHADATRGPAFDRTVPETLDPRDVQLLARCIAMSRWKDLLDDGEPIPFTRLMARSQVTSVLMGGRSSLQDFVARTGPWLDPALVTDTTKYSKAATGDEVRQATESATAAIKAEIHAALGETNDAIGKSVAEIRATRDAVERGTQRTEEMLREESEWILDWVQAGERTGRDSAREVKRLQEKWAGRREVPEQ